MVDAWNLGKWTNVVIARIARVATKDSPQLALLLFWQLEGFDLLST